MKWGHSPGHGHLNIRTIVSYNFPDQEHWSRKTAGEDSALSETPTHIGSTIRSSIQVPASLKLAKLAKSSDCGRRYIPSDMCQLKWTRSLLPTNQVSDSGTTSAEYLFLWVQIQRCRAKFRYFDFVHGLSGAWFMCSTGLIANIFLFILIQIVLGEKPVALN